MAGGSIRRGVEWEACALVLDGEVLDVWPSAMPSRPLDIVAASQKNSGGARPGPNSDVHGLVQRIVHGMRVDHGYVHLEFFEAGGEIYAGEVGVRVAGCEITANHGHAYGFDVFGATLDAYQGRRPVLDYTARRCVGDLLLPMPRSGTVRPSLRAKNCLDLPGVIEAELRVAPGDRVRARRASHNACGYIHVPVPRRRSRKTHAVRTGSVLDRHQVGRPPRTRPATPPQASSAP